MYNYWGFYSVLFTELCSLHHYHLMIFIIPKTKRNTVPITQPPPSSHQCTFCPYEITCFGHFMWMESSFKWSFVIEFFFLGPHLRHMEVPGLGVESELPAYAPVTATWDLSWVCDLHHSSRQCWILNPLSEARDRTCNVTVPSRICFRCAATETPIVNILPLLVLALSLIHTFFLSRLKQTAFFTHKYISNVQGFNTLPFNEILYLLPSLVSLPWLPQKSLSTLAVFESGSRWHSLWTGG